MALLQKRLFLSETKQVSMLRFFKYGIPGELQRNHTLQIRRLEVLSNQYFYIHKCFMSCKKNTDHQQSHLTLLWKLYEIRQFSFFYFSK